MHLIFSFSKIIVLLLNFRNVNEKNVNVCMGWQSKNSNHIESDQN